MKSYSDPRSLLKTETWSCPVSFFGPSVVFLVVERQLDNGSYIFERPSRMKSNFVRGQVV
jgi:hypothetical protein